MAYVPQLIDESTLRNSFSPSVSISDISSSGCLAIIEIAECYIKDTYFNGTMPASNTASVPALMISMSKIINANPALERKYKPVKSFKIGDYSVNYGSQNYTNDLMIMSHKMLIALDMKARDRYIYKVNK